MPDYKISNEQIDDTVKAHAEEMKRLAKEIDSLLQKKVELLCEEHQIDFDVGMGNWSFDFKDLENKKAEYYYHEWEDDNKLNKMAEDLKWDLENADIPKKEIPFFENEIFKAEVMQKFHPDVKEIVSLINTLNRDILGKHTRDPLFDLSYLKPYKHKDKEEDSLANLINNFEQKNDKKQEDRKLVVKPIVVDEGDGILINNNYNQWASIKNETQSKEWKESTLQFRTGTYNQFDLQDTIKNFENATYNGDLSKQPIKERDFLEKSYLKEVDTLLNGNKNTRKQR